jgi:hypothetical protein
MKKLLLLSIFLFANTIIFGQKTELSIGLNSGLFSFSGKSAEKISSINFDDKTNSGYTNNPYGSELGLCYGISGNVKRVTKSTFIIGFELGYETLRSKVLVNAVNGYTGTSTYQDFGVGSTILNLNCVNLYPYFGKRFNVQKFSFDFLVGSDFSYIGNAYEKGILNSHKDGIYETSKDRNTIDFDLRPRIQLTVNYQKTGVYFGYSSGLVNYKSEYDGSGIDVAYGNLIRFGVSYRLR